MAGPMFVSQTTIFTDPRQVATIIIPDGHRVIVLLRGEQPIAADISEPGEYEVSAEALADGVYPVAFCLIDAAHVQAWESLSVETVGRMLDRCQGAVDEKAKRRIN